MRLWYLSHRRPAKAQASLRIRAVSPERSLFAHMKYGSRQRVRPKIRHLAPLDVCTCNQSFEEWVYGRRCHNLMKSHELAQLAFTFTMKRFAMFSTTFRSTLHTTIQDQEVSLGSKHELLRKCPMLNISPTLLGGVPPKTILDQVWNLLCVAGNVWKITKILVHFQFHSVFRQNDILENWNISHRIRMCRLWNTCLFLVNLYWSPYLFPHRVTFVTLERFVTQHLTPCLKSRRRKV